MSAIIGRGAFSTVFRGKLAKRDVAVKMVRWRQLPENYRSDPPREVECLQRLRGCPNCVDALAYESNSEGYTIAQPLFACDMRKVLRARLLRDSEARCVLRALACALECMRVAGVVHRDIKPDNIFMTVDGAVEAIESPSQVVLGDFGFGGYGGSTVCGSPLYMAPEQLQHNDASSASDVWSVGTVVFEALFGRVPFSGRCCASGTLKGGSCVKICRPGELGGSFC